MHNMVFSSRIRSYAHRAGHDEFGHEWTIDVLVGTFKQHWEQCWHCEFGPAMYYFNSPEWWLLDSEYEFNEWLTKIPVSDQFKLKLVLKYT